MLPENVKTTVKLIAPNRIGGYVVWFGTPQLRDLYGEYFSKETKFYLNWYDRRPVLYQHGFDEALEVATIGYIDTVKVDNVGVYAEATLTPDLWEDMQLELREDYLSRISRMVADGKLAWSSGTVSHVALVSPEGHIERWPIVEGSLTPEPAEPRGTIVLPAGEIIVPRHYSDMKTVRAAYKSLKLDTRFLDENPIENPPKEGDHLVADKPPEKPVKETVKMDLNAIIQGVMSMLADAGLTPEQLTSIQNTLTAELTPQASAPEMVADPMAMYTLAASRAYTLSQEALKGGREASALHNARLQAAMDVIKRSNPPTGSPGFSGLGLLNGQQPRQQQFSDMQDLRYDHLSAEDMAFGIVVMKAANQKPSDSALYAAAYKAAQKAEAGKGVFASPSVRRALPGVKVNEIVATNLSGFGTEWTGVAYETRLWEAVHESPMYQEMLQRGAMQLEVPQGVSSIDIPTEGSDPVWTTMPELNDMETDDRPPARPAVTTPSTGKRSLAPTELGARIIFTDTMEEDSLFPLLPFYRTAMERSAQETVESIVFNGDTATAANTNLNLIDSTPTVDSKGRGPAYLSMNGMLKLGLITNSALSRDAGVAFDDTDFIATLQLLPAKHQVATDRLMYVIDPYVSAAAMNIAAFKTRDVFTRATLENGMLINVLGIDVRRTGFIERANALGRISATPGNNTRGRLSLVRPDQWAFGWKRRVRTEVERDIQAAATIVVSTLRFAMTYRSTTSGVAVTYNIAV